MIDATSRTTSVAALASVIVPSSAGRFARAMESAAVFTHGAEPTTPAAIAMSRSGLRNHRTVYGVGAATPKPAIAFRNPIAPVGASGRRNTAEAHNEKPR